MIDASQLVAPSVPFFSPPLPSNWKVYACDSRKEEEEEERGGEEKKSVDFALIVDRAPSSEFANRMGRFFSHPCATINNDTR